MFSTLPHSQVEKLSLAGFTHWKRYASNQDNNQGQQLIDQSELAERKRENLVIKGDNLAVLKILKKQLAAKVKLIYLDPPYNTGKESFHYRDKLNSSAWLQFMRERLKIAKTLLTSDGVILVSIDDNEQASLKALMDEVFGRVNFVITFIWQRKKGAQGVVTKNMVVNNHEYIIVFAKQKSKFHFKGLDRDQQGFNNPDNDPRGKWKRQYLQRFGQNFPQRTITNPQNNMQFTFETPYTEDKLNQWIKEKIIMFPDDRKKYPARKEFLKDYPQKKQLVSFLGLFPSKSATEELYRMFDGEKVFKNPKPVKLIKFIVEQTTAKDDLVLDFFAGSGTTGQAVLEMNQEDGGDRKFILVEQMDFIKTVLTPRLKKVLERGKMDASFVYCELA